MWIFLNDAFLSAVQHRDAPDSLMVRARRREDLARVFGDGVEIVELADADYPYRVTVPKAELAVRLAARVEAIDYDNFKNSVPERRRHDAYMDVWSAMRRFEQR
jgi:hypothetical protein